MKKISGNNQLYLHYGHTLRAVGRIEEAIKAYKRSIKFEVNYGEAYWALANLKTYEFSESDKQNINKLLHNKNILVKDTIIFLLWKGRGRQKNYKKSIAAYRKAIK